MRLFLRKHQRKISHLSSKNLKSKREIRTVLAKINLRNV
jgi:hypothetical protein